MPMRVTYSHSKVNTNTKTIHIMRCLVIPPGPVAVLTRPTI
nr:MAG TPA: Chloramphenicol resistance gene leader peptide [Caudoviricetes sp.]